MWKHKYITKQVGGEFVNIIIGGLVGAFCSLIITLIFYEPFKQALAFIIMKLGPLNNSGLSGRWVAKFYYTDVNGVVISFT